MTTTTKNENMIKKQTTNLRNKFVKQITLLIKSNGGEMSISAITAVLRGWLTPRWEHINRPSSVQVWCIPSKNALVETLSAHGFTVWQRGRIRTITA